MGHPGGRMGAVGAKRQGKDRARGVRVQEQGSGSLRWSVQYIRAVMDVTMSP